MVFAENQNFVYMLNASYTQIYTNTANFLNRHVLKKTGFSVSFDGVQTVLPSTAFSGSRPAVIFAYSNAGVAESVSPMKLFGMQISEGSVLNRDFVPCADPDGQVGLYDLIGDRFYGNAGSGDFLPGPEKEPEMIPNPQDPCRWYDNDAPTALQMARYLSNVSALRSAIALPEGTPVVPRTIADLTYRTANDIERILEIVDKMLSSSLALVFCAGDLYCGEV